MNTLKNYVFFNPQYNGLSRNQLIFQYQKDKENPLIICSFEEFKEKYPDFDIHFYKNAYKDLKDKNNKELINHWLHFGIFNHYISSKNDFYEKYPQFDLIEYQKKYNLFEKNENEIIFHYLNIGKYEYYQNKQKNSINIYQNQTYSILKHSISIKKIAHVFVHFFKVGGGEIFLTQFLYYCQKKYPQYQHTLFLNKHYNTHTQYKLNLNLNIEIIYYNNYDELFQLLDDYDIIYDNQLYFFHDFNPLYYKTINIIHGCSFLNHELKKNQIMNSIHLYHEKKMHISWNYIFKNINYLGVQSIETHIQEDIIKKINNLQNKLQEKYTWNVGIVGRIDAHKIPKSFLELMVNLQHKPFVFHLYGCIDSNYEMYFLDKIKNKTHIIYHGIKNHSKIHEIYLENDIILSPSKNEAGGTILLEAMNHCCLVIARNAGGNSETLQNTHFLANNDNEYIELLEKAILSNKQDWIDHIYIQKLNVLLNHNEEKQLNQLIEYSKKNVQYFDNVPNYVHYIFGLKPQTEDFSFLYFLAIYSNVLIHQPDIIYFHYHYLPKGYWWNKIKDYVILNYIPFIDFKLKNGIEIIHYAHKSDYLRLLILEKYGGIYFDIDTLVIKPYYELLKYDCVIGIQEKYKNEKDLFGNAVLLAKKNHFYIQDWLKKYEIEFNNDEWTKASLFLPTQIYENYDESQKKKIKVVDCTYFYYPNYNEEHILFHQKQSIHENSYVFHCCQNYLANYINHFNINDDTILEHLSDSLFHQYIRNILDYTYIKDKDIIKNENIKNENIKNRITKIMTSSKKESISILLDIKRYKTILEELNTIYCLFQYSIHCFLFLDINEQIDISYIEEFKKTHAIFFYIIYKNNTIDLEGICHLIQKIHFSNKIILINKNIQIIEGKDKYINNHLFDLLKVKSIYKV